MRMWNTQNREHLLFICLCISLFEKELRHIVKKQIAAICKVYPRTSFAFSYNLRSFIKEVPLIQCNAVMLNIFYYYFLPNLFRETYMVVC